MPALNLHGLTKQQIADGTGRTLQTVDNWIAGTTGRPVYLDQALRSIAAGLTPLEPAQMDELNLVRLLGIPAGTERFWRMTGYPQQARMAAAWCRRPPTSYQRTLLRHIDTAGAYYRTRNAYRARGRDLPAIKQPTMRVLERDGFVTEADGRVSLTGAARDAIYKS